MIRGNVLITGGAGAIGSNLVRELMNHDCTITILDDLTSGHEDLIPKSEKIKFLKGSVTDDATLKKIFENKPYYVFHLAALFANQNSVDNPERDLEVNARGTLNLLIHSKNTGVKKFIYTSTSCIYGNIQGKATESATSYGLDTPYAISKLAGEHYVDFFSKQYGLKTVTLRLFNSFGPGEKPGKYRNVIPNFFEKAIKKDALTIYGTGEETRDFNWIGNVVQALIKSAESEVSGETFNIGSGVETKIIDLANLINKIAENPNNHKFIPRRDWDHITNRCADISKARKMLGYAPETDNLEKQLIKTYEWIKQNA